MRLVWVVKQYALAKTRCNDKPATTESCKTKQFTASDLCYSYFSSNSVIFQCRVIGSNVSANLPLYIIESNSFILHM